MEEIRDTLLTRHGLQPDQLVVTLSPCPCALSDRTALGTVLTNVLENAVKYSRQEDGSVPPIEIDVVPTERWIKIAITDQGIGIDRKFQKRVFRRFFRVPTEEVQRRHGSGLGLFVVSEICRSLKARIAIQSPESGRGTTVNIHVPTGPLRASETTTESRTEPA